MNNSLLYKQLENEQAKAFIEKIPENIKDRCKLKKIEKGKLLVLKGNNIENIYIHFQGKMQVKNEFENGFVYSFANIKPIAYIGAMEIMANKKTYSSTLQTTTECIILKMPKSDFKNWINIDQKFTLEVLHFVSKSMYEQSLKTGEVLAYPAICILTNYLINVFENEDKDVVFLEKTREEIASILGFSVRTINRNLKELKEEKLITVNRKGISITKEQFDKLLNKLESIK
ncbi:MAG TPA: Crp/Fnr family transcriptional regulator [Romboutsia timonensis]|uniref:Crp/Fnr family transcriptional regulator n=1 Tax=Romboutsia timonensis TaxID=1776391 RepID=A0A921SYU8_9FIRM|nr:Crp/Fnr family transcriptional regulator [Romboutsia timonensis]